MKNEIACYSAVGKRSNNEDAAFARETAAGALVIVCDGVGGRSDGELASETAVEVIRSRLLDETLDEDLAEDAVIEANTAVWEINPDKDYPKTTVALLWIDGNNALAINVGDSRIYQFRDGEILFQSRDHSIPQLAVMAGEITADQIRSHPEKNRITRCLGVKGPVGMGRKRLQVLPGDRFLVCSDGLWEPVLEEDMLRTLRQSETAEEWLAAMRAIATANENDNHTAVVVLAD